jgi:hypothetical protein
MAKEQRVGLRLGGYLRDALEREAAEQGITLSEHIRRLLLMTHPHIPALEDVRRIREAGQASQRSRDYMPYLQNQLQRLQEALVALDGFDAMMGQWRERAKDELETGIAMLQEALRVLGGLDAIATTMRKGLEHGGDVHAGSGERSEDGLD